MENGNVRICPISMKPCFEGHRMEWFAGMYDALEIETKADDGPVLVCAFTDDYGSCPFRELGKAMSELSEHLARRQSGC